MVKKTHIFVKKLKILYNLVHTYTLVQISPACGTSTNQTNVYKEFRHPVSAFVTVVRNSFNAKFTAKIDFPI